MKSNIETKKEKLTLAFKVMIDAIRERTITLDSYDDGGLFVIEDFTLTVFEDDGELTLSIVLKLYNRENRAEFTIDNSASDAYIRTMARSSIETTESLFVVRDDFKQHILRIQDMELAVCKLTYEVEMLSSDEAERDTACFNLNRNQYPYKILIE